MFKNISVHKTCKSGYLLDEKVCNNLQKWNKNKCRCECLKIKDCDIGYFWTVNNCRCETKKLARLIQTEECDVKSDEIKNVSECKALSTLIKKINNCKPFICVSVLFLCVTIILIGIMLYFCLKLKKNVLPY